MKLRCHLCGNWFNSKSTFEQYCKECMFPKSHTTKNSQTSGETASPTFNNSKMNSSCCLIGKDETEQMAGKSSVDFPVVCEK